MKSNIHYQTTEECDAGPADSGRKQSNVQDACLVVIGGARLGARIVPGGEPVVIGRDIDADFQIAELSVSRRHCRIFVEDNRHWVEDLDSTNHTYVNEERVDRSPLRDGDHIRISQTTLKFVDSGNIESSYHSELHEYTIRDPLTGLFNRRHATAVLDAETARAMRHHDYRLAIVLLDIDYFKGINDEFGHLAGDRVLKQLGRLADDRVRAGDTIARIGGEEFAVIMPGSSREEAIKRADSLREEIASFAFKLNGESRSITVSGGVAGWEAGMSSIKDLLAVADRQLYEAKNQGRNRIR